MSGAAPTQGETGDSLQIRLDTKCFQALLYALIQRNFYRDNYEGACSNESIVRELYLRQPCQVGADADKEAFESEIGQYEKVREITANACLTSSYDIQSAIFVLYQLWV